MADFITQRNIAAMLLPKLGSAFATATAGGAGNATQVTGATIDRMDPSTGSLALTATLAILWSATLAATKTLYLGTLKVEQSLDGVNWQSTPYATFTDPGIVATGPTGGATLTGVTVEPIYLGSAMRWIRFDFTPTLSATNTDTATLIAAAILAGFDRLPV